MSPDEMTTVELLEQAAADEIAIGDDPLGAALRERAERLRKALACAEECLQLEPTLETRTWRLLDSLNAPERPR